MGGKSLNTTCQFHKCYPMYLNRFLVDGSCVRDSINLSCSFDVYIEHGMSFPIIYCLRCSFVDGHGMSCQSISLLQFGIQQVNGWKPRRSGTFNISTLYAEKNRRNSVPIICTQMVNVSITKPLTLGKLGRAAVEGLLK